MVKKLLFIGLSILSMESVQAQKLVVDTVCFNSPYDDYGVRMFNNELVVVSAKNAEPESSKMDLRLGVPYSDLYRVNGCETIDLTVDASSYQVPASVNSSFYDAPISHSAKDGLLFFSNNSNSKENKLGIFYSVITNGKWSDPLVFPLNSDSYNVTHPFYDEATKRLYYASDFEKGKNKYDIYYSDYNGKDWSRPVSLIGLNSDSVECFPFVYGDKLFFTSNNSSSVGGLDLFVFENGKVQNLGDGFNTTFDELCITLTSDTSGFFSSNRNSGGKHDDVFSFYYEPIPPIVEAVEEEVITEVILPKVELESVYFDFDSYKLMSSQEAVLTDVVLKLNDNKDTKIVIEGHTDNVGSTNYNIQLSKKRAIAVKTYLIQKGIDVNRIELNYYGYNQPIDTNETSDGRQKNRRVEFKIIDGKH